VVKQNEVKLKGVGVERGYVNPPIRAFYYAKSADPCFFFTPNPSIRQYFSSNPKTKLHPER